jgi:L-aminopeptidase/D-esterase-like protein
MNIQLRPKFLAVVAVFAVCSHGPLGFGADNLACNAPLRPQQTEVSFDMPGLQLSSISDPTYSTGATLLFFPEGGYVAFDARGGSVASSETTLFEEGSYSNWIDGIVFAGGSTLGLSVADGVRHLLFKSRAPTADPLFDAIPSVPSAVVYDFGGRTEPGRDRLVVPTAQMAETLMNTLSPNRFSVGRAGAGTSTTFAKKTGPRWGGQGLAMLSGPDGVKVLAIVILNPMGEVYTKSGQSLREVTGSTPSLMDVPASGRQNTTLAAVVTNLQLDRTDLKRLAVIGQSAMAQVIRPIHTMSDGDILFAVTTALGPKKSELSDKTFNIHNLATEAILAAIEVAARSSNPPPP